MAEVTININSILPESVEKKASAIQIMANKLDDNSFRILKEIIVENNSINQTLANHELTLKKALKTLK